MSDAATFGGGDLAGGGALAKAAEVFRRYDKDGSGMLDKEELVSALTELGVLEDVGAKSAGKALQQQMREADADGDGMISWREFANYFSRMAQLKAAELRAGRLKAGRAKAVVPPELFSDTAIKAAFIHYTDFGNAKGLGEKTASARQMTSQQWKRMLDITGLLAGIGGAAGGHAAADIIFARSRSAGATKLRFQSFLTALAMLGDESSSTIQHITQQLVSCMKKRCPSACSGTKQARPATSPSPAASKLLAARPESPAGSPTIAARQLEFPLTCAGALPTLLSPCSPAVHPSLPPGPCASLLRRMDCIQQLLSLSPPTTQAGGSPQPAAGATCQDGNGNASQAGVAPAEFMRVFVQEVMAEACRQAVQEAGRTVGSGMQGPAPAGREAAAGEGEEGEAGREEFSIVVDNTEYCGEGAGAGPGEGAAGELPARPRALTSLEAHALKADLWRSVDQRCRAMEARCAASLAAHTQAAEHTMQALRQGLSGLLEEASKLAASEQQQWGASMRTFEERATALQTQVDALEKIVEDSCMPAQAMQEVRAVKEDCARALVAAEAREKKMGEALLQMARRLADLDARVRQGATS